MAVLQLNMDPFYKIRSALNTEFLNPLSIVSIADIKTLFSIGITYGEQGVSSLDEIRIINSMTSSYINIHTAPEIPYIDEVLTLSPYLVTLVHPTGIRGTLELSDALDSRMIVNHILDHSESASCIRIKPDMNQLKAAYKAGFDFVELECSDFISLSGEKEQRRWLESLSGLIHAAYKHNIGVVLTGGISYLSAGVLSNFPHVDILSVGTAIAVKSIIVGIESALQDMLDRIVPQF